jgi:hypothetical protein
MRNKDHQNLAKGTSKREIKNHKVSNLFPIQSHLQFLHQPLRFMLIKPRMHLQGQKVLNTGPLDSKANFC